MQSVKLAKTLTIAALLSVCVSIQPARSSDFVKNLLQQFSGTVTTWDDLAARRGEVEGQIRQSVRSGALSVTDADQLVSQLSPIDQALVQGRASGKPLTFSQGLAYSQKLNAATAALQQAVAARESTLPDVDALQAELAQKIDEALNNNQLTRDDAVRLKGQLSTVADIESTIKSSGDGRLNPKQIETLSTRLNDTKTQLVQAIKMGESAIPELVARSSDLQQRIDRAAGERRISREQAGQLNGELDELARKRNAYSNGGQNLNGRQILELATAIDKVSDHFEAAKAAYSAASQPVQTPPANVVDLGNFPQANGASVSYKDVTGYWGEPYISTLASRGILGGFPDGTFHPNDNITRAQFAAIAVKALSVPASSGASFNDVPAKYWAANAIGAVSGAGLVTGFPDGTFKPEDKLTRAQALVILAKALNGATAGSDRDLTFYADSQNVPAWALPSVTRAAAAHIITSFPDAAAINPNALATRGDVAALMYQTLLALHKPLPRISIGLLPQFATGAMQVAEPVNNQPPQAPPQPDSLSIDNVEVKPVGQLAAGDVLEVRAFGSPGAVASFSIKEGPHDIAMTERRDGVYEGTYTVRRDDNIGRTRVIVALTKNGAQPASKQSRSELMIDALPPEVITEPRSQARTGPQPNIVVKFSDGHGSGIDPQSVHLFVNGQEVTAQSVVDAGMIAYKPSAPLNGPVDAEIKVADRCGNAVDYKWNFTAGFGGTGLPGLPGLPGLHGLPNLPGGPAR